MRHLLCLLLVLAFAVSAQAQSITNNPATTQTAPVTAAPITPAPSAPAPQASTCGDDARLMDIVSIIGDPQSITKPITVTPETYLALDAEVLQVLVGKMLICPDNPILPSGKPLKKIPVHFSLIMDKINTAVMDGNFEMVKQWAITLQPTPIKIEEINPLLTKINANKNATEKLYSALGLTPKRHSSDLLTYNLEIFIALGGKLDRQGATVYYSIYPPTAAMLKKVPKNAIFLEAQRLSSDDYTQPVVHSLLLKLGLKPNYVPYQK